MHVTTERLILRPFSTADLDDLAALNADPLVMRHFPALQTRAESAKAMAVWSERLAARGIGMLCARTRADDRFVGIIGAQWLPYDAFFTPAVEVGWRLSPTFWRLGLATEGARGAIAHVFAGGLADHVVAVTTPGNDASQAVMRRLGMRAIGAFDHPLIAPGHPMRPHVVFRLDAPAG